MNNQDLYLYSIENVIKQIADASPHLGYFEVRFYASNTRPSREVTDAIESFFYYPSGGTLRDKDLNIVFYEPRLDMYHFSKAQHAERAVNAGESSGENGA